MTRTPESPLDNEDDEEVDEAEDADDEEDDEAEDDEAEEDAEEDVDPARFLLDEDSDAPNLVPEEHPRRLLAGKIEMLEKIGEGGMGAVWRGHHLNLDRVVAVKVLDEALQLRVDGRERFIREGKALAQLDHRNVVRIFDCDQTPSGKLFLCMEMLEGETLRALIKRGGRLDPLEVIDIGLQVCDALGAAHRRGLLHRDLTPSNIMRLRDSARTIKVIDWGLCKYLDLFYVRAPQKYGAPPGSRLVTPYGCRFGTPEYMAPELLRRENPGTPSFCTDVYALAVVLFELLTGRLPFVPGDPKKPRPIRSLLPGFEYQDLETALREALRFNPDDRTQTMAELREALDLARECLLAQREPAARTHAPQIAPIAAVDLGPPVSAPAVAVAKLVELPDHSPEPAQRGPRPPRVAEVFPRPRERLAGLALSLVLGIGVGVAGTLATQHLAGEPSVGETSAVLAVSPAQETERVRAAELRDVDAAAARQAPAPVPAAAPSSSMVTPEPADAAATATAQAVVLAAATEARTPRQRARPSRPAPPAQTFHEAMARLEPKLRGCARKAAVPERPTTVQVRRKGSEIDTVRVLNLSKDHPFSVCVDQLVRKTTFPPGARSIEDVTFFK